VEVARKENLNRTNLDMHTNLGSHLDITLPDLTLMRHTHVCLKEDVILNSRMHEVGATQ
jgi:hypothetical protein